MFRITVLDIFKSLVLPLKTEQYVSERARDGFAASDFHPENAAGVELNALARTDHINQGWPGQEWFRDGSGWRSAALAFDGGNAQALAHGFEDGVLQKVIHGFGERAEAVFEFFAHVLLFFFGGNGGDAFVGAQAEIFAGNVFSGDAHVEAEIESGAEFGSDVFAFEFGDGAFEHLAVEVEADGFDVAVLLAAEHVACAAQFEVESGDAEAGAEFAELFHGGEALAGDVGEHFFGRDEEIGIGALAWSGRRGRGVGRVRRGRGGRRD